MGGENGRPKRENKPSRGEGGVLSLKEKKEGLSRKRGERHVRKCWKEHNKNKKRNQLKSGKNKTVEKKTRRSTAERQSLEGGEKKKPKSGEKLNMGSRRPKMEAEGYTTRSGGDKGDS